MAGKKGDAPIPSAQASIYTALFYASYSVLLALACVGTPGSKLNVQVWLVMPRQTCSKCLHECMLYHSLRERSPWWSWGPCSMTDGMLCCTK